MTIWGQIAMVVLGLAIATAILTLISSIVEKKRNPPPEAGYKPPTPQATPPPDAQSPRTSDDASTRKPSGNTVIDESIDQAEGCGSTVAIALVVMAMVFGLCVISVANR